MTEFLNEYLGTITLCVIGLGVVWAVIDFLKGCYKSELDYQAKQFMHIRERIEKVEKLREEMNAGFKSMTDLYAAALGAAKFYLEEKLEAKQDKAIPLCKDCRWFKHNGKWAVCTKRNIARTSYVGGEKPLYPQAIHERTGVSCGPSGKSFEPKPKK